MKPEKEKNELKDSTTIQLLIVLAVVIFLIIYVLIKY